MSRRLSFSRLENEIIHNFRDKINRAEEPEDVSLAFSLAMDKLVAGALGDKEPPIQEAVIFDPKAEHHYRLSEPLAANERFNGVMRQSDLPQIMSRFAETAIKRRMSLRTHREWTENKTRPY